MSPLNSRLQLALLNRKKDRNLLEKGFTLVELMIVIVIVGILSAVALPNFLSQTNKAKATECTSKIGAILSQVGAEHLLDKTDAAALLTSELAIANTNSALCTFTDAGLTAPDYGVNAVGKTDSDLAGKYAAKSCVDGDTGSRDINTKTGNTVGLENVDAAVCA
jgi:type IV pilus assembly protein PilA